MKQSVQYKSGHILSYAEYGDKNGFPIVIQHGMVASIDDVGLFDELINLGTHLICIARPGYGESSPYHMQNMAEYGKIVSSLVEKLEGEEFDVFGLSSGAPYSYALGYTFAQQARNIFIFSGTPALYHNDIVNLWPYEITPDATIRELERIAKQVFFPNPSEEDVQRNDIRDSMQNNCFGLAQDLQLRCRDWGFPLSEMNATVYMQHCQEDDAVPFETARITARLLPNCTLDVREEGGHFSPEALNDFIKNIMAEHY